MPRVLIPLADGFEEIEALAMVDILRRAKIDVVMAGLHPGQVVSARNVRIISDDVLDNTRATEFDMILLPGGETGAKNLLSDVRIKRLLIEFNKSGKMIGAICAAPIVLAGAGILDGKRVTSYPSYSDKLGGVIYENKPVVSDGKILTSQGPGTAVQFALAIVSQLAGRHVSEQIAADMLITTGPTQEEIWDQQLFNSTTQALVSALEMKDTYTQGHAKRVTEYSLSIGSKLNFSESEMRDLYLGSVLHDIGKLGTAEEVLNKPESLNLREETLIREHPLKGTLFIAGIDPLSHIIPTILHHHERWDGTGYPGRLKGDQIPIHARVVAVADAYDAMLSARAFRPAFERGAAVQELQKKKGTQFDPFIVDVFIECLNDSPYEMKDFSYYF